MAAAMPPVTAPAMSVIASITRSAHPDNAQVVMSIGLLRQIEREAQGGPVALATSAPAFNLTAGASA